MIGHNQSQKTTLKVIQVFSTWENTIICSHVFKYPLYSFKGIYATATILAVRSTKNLLFRILKLKMGQPCAPAHFKLAIVHWNHSCFDEYEQQKQWFWNTDTIRVTCCVLFEGTRDPEHERYTLYTLLNSKAASFQILSMCVQKHVSQEKRQFKQLYFSFFFAFVTKAYSLQVCLFYNYLT